MPFHPDYKEGRFETSASASVCSNWRDDPGAWLERARLQLMWG